MLLLRHCRGLTRVGLLKTQRVQLLQGAALPVAVCAGSLCARWGSSHGGHKSGQYQGSHGPNWRHALAGLLAGTGAVLAYGLHHSQTEQAATTIVQPIAPASSLPIYTQDEVTKHRSVEEGVWVTYKGSVYDITEFVSMHPGGDKILLAAGGALEPFWALYAVHSQDHVLEILSEYKAYLMKYGYLHTSLDPQNQGFQKEDVIEALRVFQRVTDLPVTGVIDKATLEMMRQSRCGIEDPFNQKTLNCRVLGYWRKRSLTWCIYNYTPDVPKSETKRAIRSAFKYWNDVAPLSFREVEYGRADIRISFHTKDATCAVPFDGRGASAYGPDTIGLE